jgi:uncharacterized protein (TIGR02186 family)
MSIVFDRWYTLIRLKDILLTFIWLFIPLIVFAEDEAVSTANLTLQVKPDNIDMSSFYHGTELSITGSYPPCDGLVLKLEGNKEEIELNRKGRFFVIWMNVAELNVENAPDIYFLTTSCPNINILPTHELDSLNIGYDALKKIIRFDSEKPLAGDNFKEFIKMKEKKGQYKFDPGGIKLSGKSDAGGTFTTRIYLPPKVPARKYKLWLYGFKDNRLIAETSTSLSINKVGLPLFLSNLAYQHPAGYGIMAILVALAAGLAMGFIFNRSKNGH